MPLKGKSALSLKKLLKRSCQRSPRSWRWRKPERNGFCMIEVLSWRPLPWCLSSRTYCDLTRRTVCSLAMGHAQLLRRTVCRDRGHPNRTVECVSWPFTCHAQERECCHGLHRPTFMANLAPLSKENQCPAKARGRKAKRPSDLMRGQTIVPAPRF